MNKKSQLQLLLSPLGLLLVISAVIIVIGNTPVWFSNKFVAVKIDVGISSDHDIIRAYVTNSSLSLFQKYFPKEEINSIHFIQLETYRTNSGRRDLVYSTRINLERDFGNFKLYTQETQVLEGDEIKISFFESERLLDEKIIKVSK